MSWQYTPYALLSLMTAVVAAGLSLYALRRLETPGARMGALFMAAVSLWGVANAIDLSVTDLPSKLLWTKIAYLGIVVVPLAWFGFAAEYTGRERWMTRRNLALLAVVPVLTLALVFTNETHRLFWSETSLDTSGTFVALTVEYGVGFWGWCAYAYLLLGVGALLVVSMLVRSGSLYSKQGGALLFGVLAPWLGNALYLSGLSPVPNLDLTPYFLLLTGVAMMLAISRWGLLDVVPVARAAVVEGMPDGMIVLDSQDRVLDLNPAAQAISKLPAREAVGQPADQVIASEEVLSAVYGGAGETHVRVKAGDGPARRDYEVTLSSWRSPKRGRDIRFLMLRDVTERVERELLFRLIVENASDIVSIYDPGAGTRYVSPSVERVLGYTPEEVVAGGGVLGSPEVVHPDDLRKMLEGFDRVLKDPGIGLPLELRVRHKDGSWRNMEGICNNLLGYLEVGGVVATWRDVTERVKAEEEARRLNESLERRVAERTAELEESEKKYRKIFENAVEGIFQLSAEGRVVTANPAMARILGYTSTEELLSSAPDVAGELYADPGRREEISRALLRDGSVSGFEARVLRKDGSTAWVLVSARTLYGDSGEISGFEGTLQDVTERAEARRTLERRVAGLTGIAANLTVGQPLKATLDSLAAGVVETTAALACSVYLMDPGAKTLLLSGSCGLPEGYTDGLLAAWRGGAEHPALRCFESRKPMIVRGGRRMFLEDSLYAPIHHFVREAPWEAIHITPLVARGEALGTISAYYPPGIEPSEDEVTFLGAVADQASVAVQNARLFSAAQGAATLQERQRISRELHDSVSQALYGIALGSRTARTLLDRDPARAVEPMEYVLSLAEAGLAEMRALIFELRPEALESEGLISALEKRAAAVQARYGINVRTDLCEEPDIPPESKEALYRIAQEAMYNAVKHSGASNADLSVEIFPEGISLEIHDDGAGFDPSESFPGHLGLKSMRERAERRGGTLEIESAPGKGTRIRARIPR